MNSRYSKYTVVKTCIITLYALLLNCISRASVFIPCDIEWVYSLLLTFFHGVWSAHVAKTKSISELRSTAMGKRRGGKLEALQVRTKTLRSFFSHTCMPTLSYIPKSFHTNPSGSRFTEGMMGYY